MEVIISHCVLCIEWMIVICENVAQRLDASKGRSEDIFLEMAHYYYFYSLVVLYDDRRNFYTCPYKALLISYTSFRKHATL